MSAFSRHPVTSAVPKLRAGELPAEYRRLPEPEPVDISPMRVLVDVRGRGTLVETSHEWTAWIRADDAAGDNRARGAGGNTLPELEGHVIDALDELQATTPRPIRALWMFELRADRWSDVSDRVGLRRWRDHAGTIRPDGHDEDGSVLPVPASLWGEA